MRWGPWLHSLWDPQFGLGLMIAARRDAEASLPWIKRLTITFGPIIMTGAVSTVGALFGGWVALDNRLTKIERDHLEVQAQFREKTALREEQVHELRGDIAELKSKDAENLSRIISLEGRMRDYELTVVELKALQQHEHDELEAQRQGRKR